MIFLPQEHCASHKTSRVTGFHLYEMPRRGESTVTESREGVARGWGLRGDWGVPASEDMSLAGRGNGRCSKIR